METVTLENSGAKARQGRGLVMFAVVAAAAIATTLAYSGMVKFGVDVAGMTLVEAYALGGFLEVSLVAVALMARQAALDGRPYGVLLTLTWVFSAASGTFAAMHELVLGGATTPYMVIFRFAPPLVAALMWHLALVGERHLVTGASLDERRRESRVLRYMVAREKWRDARYDDAGTARSRRRIGRAYARERAARNAALKYLPLTEFGARMDAWVEQFETAEQHGGRVDALVTSGRMRGVRGASEAHVLDAQELQAAGHVAELTAEVTDSDRAADVEAPDARDVPDVEDSDAPDVRDAGEVDPSAMLDVPDADVVQVADDGVRAAGAEVDQVYTEGASPDVPDDEHVSARPAVAEPLADAVRASREATDQELVAMRDAGMSYRKIGKEVGLPHSTVEGRVKRYQRERQDVDRADARHELMPAGA